MKMKGVFGLTRLLDAARHSTDGYKVLLRETAFREELVVGVLHFALVLVLPVGLVPAILLCLEYVILLVVEMINTAIEDVVDLCSPSIHILAKQAKDVASAAVSTMIAVVVLTWLVVLFRMFC